MHYINANERKVILKTLCYLTLSLQLYRPLNIRVMLVGLEVWNDGDQFIVSPEAGLTLDSFIKWRQTDLLPRKKHDNAQFVT